MRIKAGKRNTGLNGNNTKNSLKNEKKRQIKAMGFAGFVLFTQNSIKSFI
jgi:hypothetical protein